MLLREGYRRRRPPCGLTIKKKTVYWITRLVVHQEYRERGLAQGLLNHNI